MFCLANVHEEMQISGNLTIALKRNYESLRGAVSLVAGTELPEVPAFPTHSRHLPPRLQHHGRSRNHTIPVKERPVSPISRTKFGTLLLPETYFLSHLLRFE